MAKKRKLENKSEAQLTDSTEEQEQTQFNEEDNLEQEEENDVETLDTEENGSKSESAPAITNGDEEYDEDDEDDDADEPVQKLLEPFTKDHLVNLLSEAANTHPDVLDSIRKIANVDPVHRKIFVHGLGWDTTAETLIENFKIYGDIEDCKAVSDKISGKSKGYGFILFKHRSGAQKALKEPQKRIGNRMTSCQLASAGPVPTPSSAAAPLAAPMVSEYTQRKIYVSNVSADIDPQKLLSFFAKYGEITEGPLGLDKQTGKPRGFTLFVYKSIESAKKALEEPHKSFEGHILHCQRAIDGPKPNKSSFYQSHQPNHQSGHGFGRGVGHVSATEVGVGHMMAPSAAATSVSFNQGAQLNPVLGQALTALIASQGGGYGLTNLLGTLGSTGMVPPMNPSMPSSGHGMPGAYGSQSAASNISPNLMGGYGNQPGMQGGYANPQMGQANTGRSQGAGHMGSGAPYMGH